MTLTWNKVVHNMHLSRIYTATQWMDSKIRGRGNIIDQKRHLSPNNFWDFTSNWNAIFPCWIYWTSLLEDVFSFTLFFMSTKVFSFTFLIGSKNPVPFCSLSLMNVSFTSNPTSSAWRISFSTSGDAEMPEETHNSRSLSASNGLIKFSNAAWIYFTLSFVVLHHLW